MRIYSSDNTQPNSDSYWFDEYVGKDVWVRCQNSVKYSSYIRELYVRFLSYSHRQGYVSLNAVEVDDIDDTNPIYQGINIFPDDMFSPVEPLVVYTTQELFPDSEDTSDNLQIFNRFCGKEFWIHVGNETESDWWDSGYFRVHDIKGLIVSGDYIIDYYVDDFANNTDGDDDFPSERVQWVSTCIDAWKIFKPVDGYSTQELFEILDANDAYLASILPEDY